MGFKWLHESVGGRVQAQGDGLGVLVGSAERVVEVHQEGVAAPMQAFLDVGVGELGSV
jgi:hypothetical protein